MFGEENCVDSIFSSQLGGIYESFLMLLVKVMKILDFLNLVSLIENAL
jgi:hypothetical protein